MILPAFLLLCRGGEVTMMRVLTCSSHACRSFRYPSVIPKVCATQLECQVSVLNEWELSNGKVVKWVSNEPFTSSILVDWSGIQASFWYKHSWTFAPVSRRQCGLYFSPGLVLHRNPSLLITLRIHLCAVNFIDQHLTDDNAGYCGDNSRFISLALWSCWSHDKYLKCGGSQGRHWCHKKPS